MKAGVPQESLSIYHDMYNQTIDIIDIVNIVNIFMHKQIQIYIKGRNSSFRYSYSSGGSEKNPVGR